MFYIESRWRQKEIRYVGEMVLSGEGGMGQLMEDARQYVAQRTESDPIDPDKVQSVYLSIIEELKQAVG